VDAHRGQTGPVPSNHWVHGDALRAPGDVSWDGERARRSVGRGRDKSVPAMESTTDLKTTLDQLWMSEERTAAVPADRSHPGPLLGGRDCLAAPGG